MNVKLFKYIIVLAVIILVGAVSGCVKTPVKVQGSTNQVFSVEGGDKNLQQKVDENWEIFVENYPQNEAIDFYKNEGYGLTKITFDYMPGSGTGLIQFRKIEDDYMNKTRADYYVSGIKLLLKQESGEVYDPGMIAIQKDVTRSTSISMPKGNFTHFKVEEVIISPR